jgi:hypothetical protein
VDDGHDEDPLGPGQIDDPVALIDQLAHIVAAFSLGDGRPMSVIMIIDGVIFKVFDGGIYSDPSKLQIRSDL